MSNDNSLIIPVNQERKIFSYQIEIMAHNPRPGIIPLKLLVNNHQTSLHYQLNSQQSLSAYFRREYAEKLEIIPILLKITDILIESKNLLMQPEAFSLLLAHIFLSSPNNEPALVYLPLESSLGLAESFLGLITELKILRPSLVADLIILESLREYFRRDYTSLPQLRAYLLQLSLQGQPSSRLEQDKPFKLVAEKPSHEKSPEIIVDNKEEPQEVAEIKAIFRDKKKQIKFFLLAQIVIALLLFLCSRVVDFNNTTTTAAIVLLIGSVNILLIKKIFLKDVKEEEL